MWPEPLKAVAHRELELAIVVASIVAENQLIVHAVYRRESGFDQEVSGCPPVLEAGAQEQIVDQLMVELQVPPQAAGIANVPVDARIELLHGQDLAQWAEPRLGSDGELRKGRYEQADAINEKTAATTQHRSGSAPNRIRRNRHDKKDSSLSPRSRAPTGRRDPASGCRSRTTCPG